MFSARRRAPARASAGGRFPLDFVYVALAAFDIVTICAALLLNHVASTAFEQSVRLSQQWSVRLDELLALQRAAQAVDAPGNDVFYSRNGPLERERLDQALEDFNLRWAELMRDLQRDSSSEGSVHLIASLHDTRALMDEMIRDTEIVFERMSAGNVAGAARGMALLDRRYALLTSSIQGAISHAQQIQLAGFEKQVELARQARRLEWAIAAAILVSVAMVVAYGLHLGRVMRAADKVKADALAELERAHTRLARYADNVSHELRGPVSKMRVNLDVLLTQDRTVEDYREGLAASLEACERLSSIIDGLLFLARAENTSGAGQFRAVSLREELDLIRDFFDAAAEEAGVRLSVETPDVRVDVVRTLFQRAVVNLVSNALSHTRAGGVIVLRSRETENGVIVEVQDDGVGIAPDHLDVVFDRFHSTNAAPKTEGAGLGLGLPIAKAIAELHGGAIAIDSKVGVGTRVAMTFPRRPKSDAARAPAGLSV